MSLISRFPAEAAIRSERIRALREAAGLERAVLARLASLSSRQLEELEGGPWDTFYSHQIKLNAVAKVARVLGVQEDELIDLPPDFVPSGYDGGPLRLQPDSGPLPPPGGASRGVSLAGLLFGFAVVLLAVLLMWAAGSAWNGLWRG